MMSSMLLYLLYAAMTAGNRTVLPALMLAVFVAPLAPVALFLYWIGVIKVITPEEDKK